MLSGVHGTSAQVDDFRILNLSTPESKKVVFSVLIENLTIFSGSITIPKAQFGVSLREEEAQELFNLLKEAGY
jgi:hypothetical protein